MLESSGPDIGVSWSLWMREINMTVCYAFQNAPIYRSTCLYVAAINFETTPTTDSRTSCLQGSGNERPAQIRTHQHRNLKDHHPRRQGDIPSRLTFWV